MLQTLYRYAGPLNDWTLDIQFLQMTCLLMHKSFFFLLSLGYVIHNEMSSYGSLLSNMSILLIKSILSCCVQNGGPNKENQ